MLKFIGLLQAIFFFLLVIAVMVGVFLIEPCVFFTLLSMFGIWALPGDTALQKYCGNIWILLDQAWQTALAPLLNFVLSPRQSMMFGHPDETASSVIGKNYSRSYCFKYIDAVLSFIDPTSGSHGTKSIEADRRANYH